ncbi:type IIL restriction-modification enzyme MmeI [Streptomyces sp. NPDC005202]|uniref:type IIL restriction-modification enzyme MmeI n=1 Tax=Streptomyces sp. NPDC005202 TaxID=3157021 RepID=UPI0033BC42E2
MLGKGFVLTPDDAHALIAIDPRNADVVFPYLSGEDLNQRPGSTASRWVINFHDWSEERAAEYPAVFEIAEREVKPVRQRTKEDGSYVLRKPLPQRWWHYADKRPALYAAITHLRHVIVIARVSSTAAATLVPTKQVLHEKLVVFPTDDLGRLAMLNSTMHVAWAWKWSATMKADLQYTPSDCFETFPFPDPTDALRQAGQSLDRTRRNASSARNIGLTDLYGLVHTESETTPDIEAIRQAHIGVDRAAAKAYGWTDLDLKHGFHTTPQGDRFTITPDIQTEILDRLLELNHTRYKEEVEKGLHTPEAKRRRAAARKSKAKARAATRTPESTQEDFGDALFPQPDALF